MTKIIATKEKDEKTGEEYIVLNHNNRLHIFDKHVSAQSVEGRYDSLYDFLEDVIEIDILNGVSE